MGVAGRDCLKEQAEGDVKLYTYFRSSASFRVRIALELKNIPYEPCYVSLKDGEQKGAFKDEFPQGLLPVLQDDDVSISQSLAIIEYLDALHPASRLIPAQAKSRALVQSMAQVIACDIHPLNNLRVLKYLEHELSISNEQIQIWYRHWVSEGFEALERLVERYGTAEYCYEDKVSLVDVCLMPQMWNARRFNTNLDPYPRLVAIDAALGSLGAFKRASPEQQADAS